MVTFVKAILVRDGCVIRFEWPEEWVRSEKKANKDRKLLLKV